MRCDATESGISVDFFDAVQCHTVASAVATDAHTVSVAVRDFKFVTSIRVRKTEFDLGHMKIGVVFAPGDSGTFYVVEIPGGLSSVLIRFELYTHFNSIAWCWRRVVTKVGNTLQIVAGLVLDPIDTGAGSCIDTRISRIGASNSPGHDTDMSMGLGSG